MIAANTASGMDTLTITIPRQLPRKIRIMSETRIEDSTASWTTFLIAARTNTAWSKSSLSSSPSGAVLRISGRMSRVESTTASAEAFAFFRMVR